MDWNNLRNNNCCVLNIDKYFKTPSKFCAQYKAKGLSILYND